MNVFTFDGNLGRNAEVKQVGDSTVVEFSVGNQVGWGDKKKTNWINCSFWNREKVAPYLVKGSKVTVTGELTTREYQKKDGSNGFSMEVRVQDVSLPGKVQGEQAQGSPPQQAQAPQAPANVQQRNDSTAGDEIPF